MAQFVMLAELTQKGRENVDDLALSDDAFQEVAGDRDVELEEAMFTMGQYDIVANVEGPDAETVMDVLVDAASVGLARTETMPAFPPSDYL